MLYTGCLFYGDLLCLINSASAGSLLDSSHAQGHNRRSDSIQCLTVGIVSALVPLLTSDLSRAVVLLKFLSLKQ